MSATDSTAVIEFGHGLKGAVARDPGSGRWLWSVRWPAHRCTTEKCAKPSRPQTFRYGHAGSYEAARDAMSGAIRLGPPERGEAGAPQYVKA